MECFRSLEGSSFKREYGHSSSGNVVKMQHRKAHPWPGKSGELGCADKSLSERRVVHSKKKKLRDYSATTCCCCCYIFVFYQKEKKENGELKPLCVPNKFFFVKFFNLFSWHCHSNKQPNQILISRSCSLVSLSIWSFSYPYLVDYYLVGFFNT
jgi:hypothetical protein